MLGFYTGKGKKRRREGGWVTTDPRPIHNGDRPWPLHLQQPNHTTHLFLVWFPFWSIWEPFTQREVKCFRSDKGRARRKMATSLEANNNVGYLVYYFDKQCRLSRILFLTTNTHIPIWIFLQFSLFAWKFLEIIPIFSLFLSESSSKIRTDVYFISWPNFHFWP